MRFSVVVPVYNAGDYFARCIDSVLQQTVPDWELILVDDGSTDGSGKIADAYAERDGRIRAIHKENEGPLFARRDGIAAASGEYILCLDSDDAWQPNCLAVLEQVVEESHPDVVMFVGRSGKNGKQIGAYANAPTWVRKEDLYRELITSHAYNSMNLKLFRNGLFQNDPTDYSALKKSCSGEDKAQILWPITRAVQILFVPDVLYHYTCNPSGLTHTRSFAQIPMQMENVVFSLVYDFMQRWGMDDPASRERVGTYYLRNFLSVYYGLLRQCKTQQLRKQLWEYPWKSILDPHALKYRHSQRLSGKEKLKLTLALWFSN